MSKEAPRASIPNLELLPPLLSLWKQFLFELTYFHVPTAAEGEAMSGGRGGEGGVADLSRGGNDFCVIVARFQLTTTAAS